MSDAGGQSSLVASEQNKYEHQTKLKNVPLIKIDDIIQQNVCVFKIDAQGYKSFFLIEFKYIQKKK